MVTQKNSGLMGAFILFSITFLFWYGDREYIYHPLSTDSYLIAWMKSGVPISSV